MGQPVVHFEVMGKDIEKLSGFYSEMFGWEIDTSNPMGYGLIDREANLTAEGVGIGGGVGQAPEGYDGHVTFYVAVPDVGAALDHVERLGGTRMMGPEQVTPDLVIGLFTGPEGRTIGLTSGA